MFKITSDLNLCTRVTREFAGTLDDDATSGQWVTIDSDGKFAAIDAGPAGLAFPIWSEGNRDGTAGFTPDVKATGKLTTLYGKYRAITDQVAAADYAGLAVGDPVVVVSGGELGALTTPTAEEAAAVVGYISAKYASVVHLGTTFTNCVEFYSA